MGFRNTFYMGFRITFDTSVLKAEWDMMLDVSKQTQIFKGFSRKNCVDLRFLSY